MGLCKCPRNKVTNLFCFEHRVNVCEHCLVEKHEKCVIQSYLAWLQDSDYDSNCPLCRQNLDDSETIRLQCLHVYHWRCVDHWALNLPLNTAPAGFRCPQCDEKLFPKENQQSPVVDKLRNQLKKANWARAGLGLSSLPELDLPKPAIHTANEHISDAKNSHEAILNKSPITVDVDEIGTSVRKTTYSQHEVDDDNVASIPLLSIYPRSRDEDLPENNSRSLLPSRTPFTGCKKTLFLLLIGIVCLMTLMTILFRVIGPPSDDDPFFDPLANPNIRVADGE